MMKPKKRKSYSISLSPNGDMLEEIGLEIMKIKDMKDRALPKNNEQSLFSLIEEVLVDCIDSTFDLKKMITENKPIDEVMKYKEQDTKLLILLGTYIKGYNDEIKYIEYKKSESSMASTAETFRLMDENKIMMLLVNSIFQDFYSDVNNHPYKPSKVIEVIDSICVKNNIRFPLYKKGKLLQGVVEVSLPEELRDKNYSGAPKKKYRVICEERFEKKYRKYFEEAKLALSF